MAEALYRKYRPQIFEDVVGQEHIERTIKNAIEQDKVSHAYLFTGPRGTGKTTTARLLAKALLCEHGPTPEPDGTCPDCKMIADGEHPDVYELDAASRTGVENVREEIIGRVQFAPTRGRYKIYIIDEVHMLSTAAFNALLKTLEEPPSHVVFILATTDPQKVPETIHSRCQRFDFRRISAESIVSRLGAICVAEDVEFEGDALELIAHRAEGGMRNALTSLEQLIAFGEGKVTLDVAERMLGALDTNDMAEIVTAIGKRDVASCFRWTAEYIETGADLAQFTRDLAEHIRNMYVLTLAGADVALEVGEAVRREMTQELQWFGADRLARLLGVLGDLSAELKTSTNPRLSFEIALTRMVRPDSDLTLESLAERVEALESGYSAVAHVSNAGAAVAPATAQPASSLQASSSSPLPVAASGATAPQNTAPAASATNGSPAQNDALAAAQQPAAQAAAPMQAPASQPAAQAAATPQAASAAAPASNAPAAVQGGGVISADVSASLENPAALQRIWQAALSTLKKNKAAYGVLFLNTKAIYHANSGLLHIEFPAENAFAFKAVQKPDVQDAVSAALMQACGTALPFAYTQAGKDAPVAPAAASPVAATPAASAMASAAAASAAASAGQAAASAAPMTASTAPARPAVSAAAQQDYDIPPYDDERVPYDDVVPYGDAGSYEPAAAAPAQGGFSQQNSGSVQASGSAAAQQPAAATPVQPASAAGLPPEPDTRTSPSIDAAAPAQSPDELEAILAAGFGDGIVLKEVQE